MKLANCPFCGAEDGKTFDPSGGTSPLAEAPCLGVTHKYLPFDTHTPRFFVTCNVCGASGPTDRDLDKAREAWNKSALDGICPDAYRSNCFDSEHERLRVLEEPCTAEKRLFTRDDGTEYVACEVCLQHHNHCIDSANGIPGPRVPYIKWEDGKVLHTGVVRNRKHLLEILNS